MYVVYIDSEWIGRGSDELGSILMKGYLEAWSNVDERPEKMMFINSGVKLVCEGSDSLEPLKRLADAGVAVVACRTCLDFYDLLDKIAVGSITTAADIIETMISADKVIDL